MNTDLPTVDWNEVLLVSRHQGQVGVWVGWKRALAAFADPRLWESTEHWGDYFKRQPAGTPYGPAGYGLVVMDLDTRKAWSINDFSHPGSIHLPQDYELETHDETGARAAIAHLLARPDQWPHVKFEVMPAPGLLDVIRAATQEPNPVELTLDQVVSPLAGVEANQAALVSSRGTTVIRGRDHLVFQVNYLPDAWSLSATLGRSDIEVLEECLIHLRTEGFPSPAPELILSVVESAMEDMDDIGDEDEQPLQARFETLLDGWVSSPPRAPKI